MLVKIVEILTFFIMPIAGFFVIKNISDTNQKFLNIRTLLLLSFLIIVNYLIYSTDYKITITIGNFVAMVISYKFIFKNNYYESLIKCISLMLMISISELLLYILLNSQLQHWSSRIPGYYQFIINVLVALFTIGASKIPFFKKVSNAITGKIRNHMKFQTVLVSIFWLLVISALCYQLFKSSTTSISFWICIFVEVMFIIFMIVYYIDKNNYALLNNEFDALYGYVETMENYLENEQFNIHEYKNQLTVIKNMRSTKEIKNYINSLSFDNSLENMFWNSELKNLPKGGLKGLLQYKFATAYSKGIDTLADISINCNDRLSNMSIEDTKDLSRIIGVYLDNAIEAADKSLDKKICIEMYISKSNLNVVISNTFDDKIDVNKLGKKGFSTKGKNRGKGLYLVRKFAEENSKYELTTNVINNYFIQKIIVK